LVVASKEHAFGLKTHTQTDQESVERDYERQRSSPLSPRKEETMISPVVDQESFGGVGARWVLEGSCANLLSRSKHSSLWMHNQCVRRQTQPLERRDTLVIFCEPLIDGKDSSPRHYVLIFNGMLPSIPVPAVKKNPIKERQRLSGGWAEPARRTAPYSVSER